jgi:hypothetical protein
VLSSCGTQLPRSVPGLVCHVPATYSKAPTFPTFPPAIFGGTICGTLCRGTSEHALAEAQGAC